MNNTDRMITAATIAAVNAQMGEKKSITSGDVTRIYIHGAPCVTIKRNENKLTLHGAETLCTRKSSRLINTILSAFGDAKVKSNKGRWFIKTSEKAAMQEFTDKDFELEFTGTKLLCQS